MHCILFIVSNAFYSMYCMHSILYILLPIYFELTLKLVGHRQIDRPTDGRTDIVTYRAAIAAKNYC